MATRSEGKQETFKSNWKLKTSLSVKWIKSSIQSPYQPPQLENCLKGQKHNLEITAELLHCGYQLVTSVLAVAHPATPVSRKEWLNLPLNKKRSHIPVLSTLTTKIYKPKLLTSLEKHKKQRRTIKSMGVGVESQNSAHIKPFRQACHVRWKRL